MADDFIGICSFAKYGPSVNGATFATYTTTGASAGNIAVAAIAVPMSAQGLLQDWLTMFHEANGSSIGIIEGLGGTGKALIVVGGTSGGRTAGVRKSLPANYTRMKFGFPFMTNLVQGGGLRLLDAGTVQCTVGCDTSGRITLWRGTVDGTVIFQSAALVLSGVRHWLEVDLTFHNTTGAYEVRLDGTVLGSGSAVDLCSNANNFINQFDLMVGSTAASSGRFGYGGVYWRDNAGGTAPFLGDREFDCLFPDGDDAVVDFTPAASILGPWYAQQDNSTNAPGANQIALVPVTPEVNMTINSVGILARATSAGAKYKGVIYADSAGAPTGAPLSLGTEVIGITSGTALSLPLVTPQALTGGTPYWIGYITDTSVVLQLSDAFSATGIRKANTYTSDAPNPVGTGFTTGQSPWCIWGNCTGSAANWQNAENVPSPLIGGSLAHNQSSTIGQKDYYTFGDLPVTPDEIDLIQVSVLWQRSDAGARTGNIKIKSGGSESNGSISGITPATTMSYSATIIVADPATAIAWTEAGVNAVKAGVEVAT